MAVFDRSAAEGQELPGSTPVEEREAEAAAPAWGLVKLILFRFAFSYLFLYLMGTGAFLGLLSFIPYGGNVVGWYFQLWGVLVPWAGQHLLGLTATRHPTGSGDTMYSWVEIFCYLA